MFGIIFMAMDPKVKNSCAKVQDHQNENNDQWLNLGKLNHLALEAVHWNLQKITTICENV